MPVTRVSGLPLPVPSGPFFATSIAPNNRYLLDQNGSPWLVNGDSAWAVAYNLNSTDQTTYLSDRKSNGFNAIVTDIVGGPFMNANNANWNGEVPYTGGSAFTPNPTYWARIDTFFRLCEQYGITVFALPFDAYATNFYPVNGGLTPTTAGNIGTFLGNRYKAATWPGIVWMWGNDYGGGGATGGAGNNPGGINYLYEPMISAITAAGGSTLQTTEFDAADSIVQDTTDTTFLALNNISWGYCYTVTYENVLRGYAASPTMPLIFGEGAYENSTVVSGESAPLDIRKQIGWTMTSGGCGYFYGNDSLVKFQSGWQSALDTTIVAHRKAMLAAFAGIKWWTLAPDTSSLLVTAGRNTQLTGQHITFPPTILTSDATYGNYVTAAYSADGKTAAVYNPNSSTITLSSAQLAANPQIAKVDPTNGNTTNLGWTTNPSGGTNAGGDTDWLYLISAG